MSSQTTLSELKGSVSNFLAQPEIYELVRVPSSDEAQIEHFKQTGYGVATTGCGETVLVRKRDDK